MIAIRTVIVSIIVVFGLIVAGCGTSERMNQGDIDNAYHFLAILSSVRTVNETLNTLSIPIDTNSTGKMNLVLLVLEDVVNQSQAVRDSVLIQIDPNLPLHFRQQLIMGIEFYIRGVKESSPTLQLKGQALQGLWGDWYTDNRYMLSRRLQLLGVNLLKKPN